jgi:phenylacetate-CoA ligase
MEVMRRWGAEYWTDILGMSEAPFGGVSCAPASRGEVFGVHLCETSSHFFTVDPETREPIFEDGKVGEGIMTSFKAHLQPIIKYRTHDLVRLYRHHDHGCGWTATFLDGVVIGRTDYMVTLRGVNIYPTAVEHLITDVPELSPVNYEIHISEERGLDRMMLKIEPREEIPSEKQAELKRKLEEVYRVNLTVGIEVEVCPVGSLARSELKTKRLFDHREKVKK